ncbi:MAG: bifunctional phosphopantothenoylcysteine decarboxylase/phosphopantothenate--cysteine ligase CoaBC [Nitrosopumilaceae archaeon]|nr:bifunctional phosphopantothenoylcysteine decarboxylase/phosphopantothenate--cysteine ligase CoaBC [Nitrosopumilaceae archaeon]
MAGRRGEGTGGRERRAAGRPGGGDGGGKNSSKKSRGRRGGEVRHPSLDIVSSDGRELRGKRIVLCIAGSVAAYKAIELARLLMRHGCSSVTCVATKAATRLIRPAYLKWATGNDVITDLTGDMEHIRLADYGRSDIVVVYPATANTIGRLANGMDDAPVSTVLTVALGSKIPIVVCPAMHESMYENPAVLRNIGFLSKRGGGVSFVGPRMEEGKAKAPEPEHVLDHVISRFGPPESPLRGARVLLTAGPTVEFVDPVRVISNVSSGRTGVLLGAELTAAGARVTMIYGPGRHEPPKGLKTTRVETSSEMRTAVRSALKGARFDVIVMAAAVSDYAPARRRRTKIKSGGGGGGGSGELTIRLRRVPKIIGMARRMQRDALLVGFKAEADVSRAALIKSARASMTESGADVVVANDVGSEYKRRPGSNNVIVVSPSSESESGWRKKEAVAGFIKRAIEAELAAATAAAGQEG